MKHRTNKRARIILSVLAAFFSLILCCDIFLLIANGVVDNGARTLPSYAMEPLSNVLKKENFSEEDYAFLYRQTGVGRVALDEMRGTMSADELSKKLSEFQAALFFDGEIRHSVIAEYICHHDTMYTRSGAEFAAPVVTRKAGDVLLTSSTHTIGWAHGHAALVLKNNRMMQSATLGSPSQILSQDTKVAGLAYFNESSNFMILRLKDDVAKSLAGKFGIPAEASADEVRAHIADYAERHLAGVDYSLTVGVFSPKDQGEQPTGTQCAHLVWQAFKYFGLDIDSDGGLVVSPQDIARCGLFDVLQVYGFDPETLW